MGPDKKITEGLVLYLDATNPKSYPGSGSSWFDLISNESTGAFINGPTTTASFGGGRKIVFDATNDYIRIGNRNSLNPREYVTAASWFVYKTTGQYYPPVIFKKTTGNSYYEQYALAMDNGYVVMKIGNGSNSNTAVGSSTTYTNQLIYAVGIIDTPARAFRVYVDGTCVGSGSHTFATMATSSVDLAIGGSDVSNFYGWFGGDIYTAEVYNRVLTDAEILQNYNAVAEKFGKNVVVTDLDAMAFINKAMLSSETQKKAVNDLVVDMKTAGIWTKMKAIYPFVGGTAASHKWNLKDPRDVDAAYRLEFNGGWTHSISGSLPNGTNAYARTFLIPANALTAHNISLSYYSRTNSVRDGEVMGSDNNGNPGEYCRLRIVWSSSPVANLGATIIGGTNVGITYASVTDTRGLFSGIATDSSTRKFVRNGQPQTITSQASIGVNGLVPSPYDITLSCINSLVGRYAFDNKECAFASIGDGLTDAEASSLYTIVQKYQTTLGRQV
jgi:hypothetical protein